MPVKEEQITVPYLKEKGLHKTYENGYQFVYVPKRGEVFNISTWVKTGSIHEYEENSGVSHFLEHLMFKGTERFKPGEFDKAMESMGAIINAATWKDFTFYYVTGPKGAESKNFIKALDMHADMLLYSTLPDEEIGETHDPGDPNSKANKRERGVVIEEIGMREDQPWTKIYQALNAMMYPEGHPYQRDVIGTRQIIGNIPRDYILDYYNRWYGAENLATIVVGDFDPDWLEEQVLKHFDFSKQNRNGSSEKPFQLQLPEIPTSGERFAEIKGEYQTTFFIMGFHGPNCTDLKEAIAVDVASKVLGEGRTSRLYQAFIEKPKEPIFNTVSTGQSTFRLGNVIFVQGNFNSTDTQNVLDQVHAEMRDYLTKNPITQAEFERSVKKMKVDFAETSETASGVSESLGESITISGTLDSYLKYPEVLQQLTREDVQRAAERWFNLESCYTAVLVPKGNA
jgi:zinc protease